MYTFQVDKEFLVRDDVEVSISTYVDGSLKIDLCFNDITLILNTEELLAIEGDEVVTLRRDSENDSIYV